MLNSNPQVSVHAQLINFGWRLCRQPYQDSIFDVPDNQAQAIPAWTGFNAMLQENNPLRECSICYCEVIDASPTELPTVYTVLHRSLTSLDNKMLSPCSIKPSFKVLEIIWQNQEEFKRIVVRMGTFHTICA